jgi:hypothetical protein
MKNIKNFIVLLFVLFSIQAIAQTTYKVEPYEYGGNTYTIVYKVTLPPTAPVIVDDISDIITFINSDVNYNLIFNGNLNFSGQSLITLTPTLTTINGTLTVGDVNIGSITVNGTLNANSLTINTGKTLTVNGNVYTNTLTNNGTISVNDYKILKVTGNGNYTGNGTKNFSANAIVIDISHEYNNLPLSLTDAKWNFVGFPASGDLSFLTALGMPEDIWAIEFDHNSNIWNTTQYLHYDDVVSRGEGIFVFPDGAVSTTLDFTTNNADLNISHYSSNTNNGNRWYALANPFTRDISIYKLINKNNKNQNRIQGGVVYTYDGTTFSHQNRGFIQPLQGFFINVPASNTTIDFKLDEIYYQEALKSETAPIDEITLDVVTDDYAVPVSFKHNEAALAEYDIFDANKMFGTGEVAEPYFVLGERSLCIEAANTLPYVAEMNIRSGEARDIKIVASDIPEQYEVILKDGEEEIALEQGSIYETLVVSGENEDRFQVIINKKNGVSISDVENVSETSISQYNRNIIIEGGNNIHTEIFNMLGQKVYETSSRNFTLNNANAGTYVVKVKDGNSVNTTKIVIK